MLPLVAIATAVIPDLIRLLAGDKADKIASTVEKVVAATTGTDDAAQARQLIEANPALAAQLREKLAAIALEETRLQNEREASAQAARLQSETTQRQHTLEVLRAQLDADRIRRDQQFNEQQAQVRLALEQTAGARSLQMDLVKAGNPLQWAPAAVSIIVTLLFAGALLLMLFYEPAPLKEGQTDRFKELINICIGALVAGFSTVISYWLGSSLGSREKDTSNQRLQAAQSAQTSQQIDIVSRQVRASEEARQRPAEPTAPPISKGETFDSCLTLVLGAEGGFVDDPRDRGGATKYGITQETLAAWRRSRDPGATVNADHVRELKIEEAKEIYRSRYWNVLRCDDLPKGVDLLVFDLGVNAGPARSAKILQDVLGVEQDGSIGPVTLNGLNTCAPDKIIREFSAKRLEFYRSLEEDFKVFGVGWTNRTKSMLDAALAMAMEAAR
jgi:lysozyme family protein